MENLIQKYFEGSYWVDYVFIAVILYFMLTNKGFIQTGLEILGSILSLLFSYKLYAFLGGFIKELLFFPKGMANALGFFVAWFIGETIFYFGVIKLFWPRLQKFQKHPLNVFLGQIAALAQASLIFLLFISLVFVFPIQSQIKGMILQSKTGPFFVNLSQSMERQFKQVFGEAISETINFLTVKPGSEQSVALEFKLNKNQIVVDWQSEKIMLALVNEERRKRGLSMLIVDDKLERVARSYASEMMTHGFFSHVSLVDGSTALERAIRGDVSFSVVGENLAYAPDVYIAHQGLMNSQGHRENILHQEFGRIGIGVIDGGIYGKMFVQLFAD